MKTQQIILDKNLIANIHILVKYDADEVLQEIIKTLKKCAKYLSVKSNLSITIKPTNNLFVKKKLYGVAGYTPRKDTIILSLYPKTKNWKKIFPITLVHEYNHALAFHYYPNPKTAKFKLIHGIISEGIADNFVEKVIGKTAPWVSKNSFKIYKKYFPEIKNLLDRKNMDVYNKIFLGEGKYPLWIGYAIGDYIVKNFLNQNPKLKWDKIIQLSPREIWRESKILKSDCNKIVLRSSCTVEKNH
jgi:uncharacterized protein YjaZ